MSETNTLRKRRFKNEAAAETETNNNSIKCRKLNSAGNENNNALVLSQDVDQRCGKILRIHLINFMCHSNLTIELHKRINFLVGSNGSGKSSIMAAIVVGLGGKTKASSRSSNLKNLIQKGKTSAKIEIDIYNGGPEAYEPATFGDVITVVRNITMSSGTYVIKNAAGHVVSRKHDDLTRILLFHNLQPENPVFIMNQESTRNFLKTMEPGKNYQMFLKATQIELVVDKLMDCRQYHESQMFNLQCLQEQVVERKAEVEKLRNQLQKVLSLEKLKHELEDKECELAWAFVHEKNKIIAETKRTQENKQKERENLQLSITNRDNKRLDLQTAISALEHSVADEESVYQQESNEVCNVKAQLSSKTAELSAIQREIHENRKQLKQLETQIEDFRRIIIEREKDNPDIVAEKQRKDENAKSEIRKLLSELQENKANIQAEFQGILQQQNDKESEFNELKNQQRSIIDRIEKLRAEMRSTAAHKKNRICAYGEHMPQLLKEISSEYKRGTFKEMPRGPIGSYLDVCNMEYAGLIEFYLRGLLHTFIVSCAADRVALQKIFDKYSNYKPSIITTQFTKQPYDTSQHAVMPPDETRLLLDELKCSDTVVLNCLIDQKCIETVLIAKHKAIAERYTAQQENVPRNLTRIFTQVPHMEIYPDPYFRMYSLDVQAPRFLQQNTKDLLQVMEEGINHATQKLDTKKEHISFVQKELEHLQIQLRKKGAERSRNEREQHELELKLEDLNSKEYPDLSQIIFLRKELSKDEEKLETAAKVFTEKRNCIAELEAEENGIQQILQEMESKLRNRQQEIQNKKLQIKKLNQNLNRDDNNFLMKQEKLKTLDVEIHNMAQQIVEDTKEFVRLTAEATIKGAEVESTDEVLEVQRTIKKISQSIKKCSLMGVMDNIPELQEMLKVKEHTLYTDQNNYDTLKMSIELLEQSLRERFDFVKKLRAHMSMLLQFTFNQILKARNFNGSVEIDFKDKKLDLHVVPRQLEGQECVSSTRALSGGERSYSTVAFLLSLWACVDHPFFFLDEYDVFTDEVNREYMTRLLIAEGRKRPDRQYVFLTPLDMSVAASDLIKIHRLAAPRR